MMTDLQQSPYLPRWLAVTAILLLVISVAAFFLTPSYLEFPMDDTYIHLVYAENLAESGKLFFSFPEETGVGVTSILWVMLLAAGHKLGISIYFLAKILGVASMAIVAVGLYSLIEEKIGGPLAFLGVVYAVVAGNLAWFALSGMETMLFLAIGVLALIAYRQQRWGWMGFLLGLLTLTRPEGLALACSLVLIEVLHRRRIRRSLMLVGVIALIAGPWFVYLYARSGHFLPTSGVGKHMTHRFAISYILERNPILPGLRNLPFLTYIGAWVVFLLGFTFGGIALPAPRLTLGPLIGIPEISISAWAPMAWVLVLMLLSLAARRVLPLKRWQARLQDPVARPLLALLVWAAIHNLLFIVYLPVPGTASRYGAINHLLIWVAIIFGLRELSHRRNLQLGVAGALAVLVLSNLVYWDSVYTANLEHMEAVRIHAAHYIRDNLPAGELCAASDIGAIRYHSGRPILDLGALVDPDASEYFLTDRVDQYLVEKSAGCLVIPGHAGAFDEGWFDLVEILGIDQTDLISIEPVADFNIAYDRWLLGYLPTNNYQASVNIYRVQNNGGSRPPKNETAGKYIKPAPGLAP